MQKLISTLLISGASATDVKIHANELFLNKPKLTDNVQQLAMNIDTNEIAPCQYYTNSAIYSVQGIIAGDFKDTDQTITYNTGPGNNVNWNFNFCESAFKSTDPKCKDITQSTYAYEIEDGPDGICKPFTYDVGGHTDTAGSEIKNDDNVIIGLTLTFSGSEQCSADSTKQQKLAVKIMCPESVLNGDEKYGRDAWRPLKFLKYDKTDTCLPTISYEHVFGCPAVSMDQFAAFMAQYYYLWGAGLIVLGIFLAFFGNKFVNVVLFLVGAFATFIVLGALFFNVFLKKVNQQWGLWVALGGIVLASLIIGYGLMKFRKLGVAIFSAWGGVMIGFIVTTTFVVPNVYAYYGILGACGVALFFLAWKIEETVVILLTAFIGSYSLVRGVSLYAGGFPSETQLQQELASGIIDWQSFPKTYYGYLAAIIGITFVSAYFQIVKNRKLDESKAEMKKFLK